MDCLSDIVWDFGDEEDRISDEFCASSGGAGWYVAFLGASPMWSQDYHCASLQHPTGAICLSTDHLGAKPAVPRGFGSLGFGSLASDWLLALCHCNGLIFDYRLCRETRTLLGTRAL
jgi:hypothetical protein